MTRRTSRRRAREDGFTLIELLVVIVIIGLLATIVVINVLPAQDQAQVTKAQADIALLEQGMEQFKLDAGRYPTTAEGLQALAANPGTLGASARYRSGGYIKRLPDDPWNQPYQYASPGRHGPFDIYSLGADGVEGGEDQDADIGNWRP